MLKARCVKHSPYRSEPLAQTRKLCLNLAHPLSSQPKAALTRKREKQTNRYSSHDYWYKGFDSTSTPDCDATRSTLSGCLLALPRGQFFNRGKTCDLIICMCRRLLPNSDSRDHHL